MVPLSPFFLILPYCIKYEIFNKNKVFEISDLAKKLGLKDVCSIDDKVNVQYQVAGDHSIRWVEFFGERNLRTLNNICSERMKYFGYV